MTFFLTPKGLACLKKMIQDAKRQADQAAKSGTLSGSEQDGHHDEGYQLSLRETAVHDRRVQQLMEVLQNTKVLDPVEQSEEVRLGNGVELLYPNGARKKCILEGYAYESPGDIVSVNSPLGKAIVGARIGDIIDFELGDKTIEVRVVRITSPLHAEDIYHD